MKKIETANVDIQAIPKTSSKKLVVKGFIWNGIQLVVNQSFKLIIKLLLAKLLFPEQFGIIGMASVFIGFIQIFNDLGFGSALIQKKEEEISDIHYQTAFWTGVIWALCLYLIISFIVGPLASIFYEQEILKSLIPVLSLGLILSPINTIHSARLTKKMDFKKITIINNTANIFSGLISLLLAYLGAGVWALAFNSIASASLAAPLYFKATKWKPRFLWDKKAFKEIFGFGIYTTGTNTVNYWMQNLDYLLIGKFVNATTLGIYTLAFVLTDTFRTKLMSTINTVMFPLFSKNQDDHMTLTKYYFKTIFYNCAIVSPIMVFFIIFGKPFIISFLGDKWIDSIAPLQIISLSVIFHLMTSGINPLIRAMGKPNLEFKIQVIKSIIYLPMLIIGVYFYGIIGAAYVVLINKIISVFIAHYAINIVFNNNIKFIQLVKSVLPSIIASVAASALSYILYFYGLNFIICSIILFITYSLMIFLIRKDEILELKKIVLKK